jgi:hypothetical protein
LGWLTAALGAIGFIGVARWVSYPFVPARMLFVLPFFLLLVAQGATQGSGASRRWGNLAVAAMLLISLSGIWCYFHKTGFRNKQYPLPIQQIADRILRDSRAVDSRILVDSANSDPIALLYALNRQRPFLQTALPETPAELTRLLADPQVRTIWFLRNTHDVSPNGLNTQFQAQPARMTGPYTLRALHAPGALPHVRHPRDISRIGEFRR